MARAALTLTGERTLPGIWHENYWLRRHQAAYDVFAPLCAGARVLEAGCGEGYGAARLSAEGARVVIGVDLDSPTLSHLLATYPSVFPVRANLVHLPCADASIDVVVSAQTIEHL
jgi:cyclopropane fatty-acyl-phospholipid synthase-like methyltransferase